MNLVEWVDEILFREWDPIGVNDNPQLADEYTSYAPQIADLVARGAPPEVIAGQLDRITTQEIGLEPDPENAYRVALILLVPKNSREEG